MACILNGGKRIFFRNPPKALVISLDKAYTKHNAVIIVSVTQKHKSCKIPAVKEIDEDKCENGEEANEEVASRYNIDERTRMSPTERMKGPNVREGKARAGQERLFKCDGNQCLINSGGPRVAPLANKNDGNKNA